MTTEPDRGPKADVDGQEPESVIAFNDDALHVDFAHQEVTINGVPVDLNPTEYRLLITLVRHQGRARLGRRPQRPHRPVKDALYRLLDKLEPGWSWQEGGYAPIERINELTEEGS
jgi:hypothetical protein